MDKLPHGRIEVRAAPKAGDISDLFGVFKNSHGIHLTIDEINDVAWAPKRSHLSIGRR